MREKAFVLSQTHVHILVCHKKTCILVTHNLFHLRQADRILVLKDSKIVEDGTFESLRTSGIENTLHTLFHSAQLDATGGVLTELIQRHMSETTSASEETSTPATATSTEEVPVSTLNNNDKSTTSNDLTATAAVIHHAEFSSCFAFKTSPLIQSILFFTGSNCGRRS